MQDKIKDIKSSKEYFDYRENLALVNAYKTELINFEK